MGNKETIELLAKTFPILRYLNSQFSLFLQKFLFLSSNIFYRLIINRFCPISGKRIWHKRKFRPITGKRIWHKRKFRGISGKRNWHKRKFRSIYWKRNWRKRKFRPISGKRNWNKRKFRRISGFRIWNKVILMIYLLSKDWRKASFHTSNPELSIKTITPPQSSFA